MIQLTIWAVVALLSYAVVRSLQLINGDVDHYGNERRY